MIEQSVIAEREARFGVEEEFWLALMEIARVRNMTLSPLMLAIRQRHRGNLPPAMRVFIYSIMIAGSWLQPPLLSSDHSR
jgi:predicted DNA-binding ribbon-helix-helix protein